MDNNYAYTDDPPTIFDDAINTPSFALSLEAALRNAERGYNSLVPPEAWGLSGVDKTTFLAAYLRVVLPGILQKATE